METKTVQCPKCKNSTDIKFRDPKQHGYTQTFSCQNRNCRNLITVQMQKRKVVTPGPVKKEAFFTLGISKKGFEVLERYIKHTKKRLGLKLTIDMAVEHILGELDAGLTNFEAVDDQL